jgi:L-fucose mutarotase
VLNKFIVSFRFISNFAKQTHYGTARGLCSFSNFVRAAEWGLKMLRGIPAILSPELLKVLDEMGHTDELTIGDGNFPGHTYGKKVIRLDGHGVPEILDAVLKFFPLDSYVDHPVTLMEIVPGDPVRTPIWDEYKKIVARYDKRGTDCFGEMDKWDFYKRTQEKSTVVIMTSESALYANIILRKGVVVY